MAKGFEIFPEVSGTLSEKSPSDLIILFEKKKITGVLEAHDGPSRFELVLRGGEVIDAVTTVESDDPLESFLNLEKGRYRLRQQLLLPDGDLSDQKVAVGSLEDHGPISLVQSCELGGLHGTLRIKSGGRIVEVLFDAGVLTTITLDGHQDIDERDVWTWTKGEWAILALPALEPAPDPCDSGMEFLQDFEVAAVNFISDAQQDADDRWGLEDSRELLVAEEAKGGSSKEVRPKRPDERTVRVVYYDTATQADDPTPLPSRYSDADVTSTFVYKRPKQKIIVENTDRGSSQDGEILSLAAAMPSTEEVSKDPIELAFAPAERKRPDTQPQRISKTTVFNEPEPKKRDNPWPVIIVTVVLLGLIGLLLYLLSMMPGEELLP